MNIDRRDFLKTAAGVAAAAATGSAINVLAGEPKKTPAPVQASKKAGPFAGIIYTKQHPGQWQGKEAVHVPEVTVKDGKVSVVTKHPSMTAEHFVVRHTVVLANVTVIGSKTFAPGDKPESSFDLPKGSKGKAYATSFCNQHDFWVTEFTI
jgi:superoxide reductase